METLRITQICPSYLPYIGGVEYVVKSLSEWLVKLGHEVCVHTLDPSGKLPSKERIGNVEIIRYLSIAPNNAYYIPFPQVLNNLQIRKSDLVHVHNIHTIYSLFVLSKGRHSKLKSVVLSPYYHGYGHSWFRNSLWHLYRPVVSELIRQVNAIHTVSKLEAKLVEAHFGRQPIVIENGVDNDVLRVNWSPCEDKVLYAGRIEKYKRIEKMGELVKVLNENYGFDLQFTIIGAGSYKKKLEERLRFTGIEHRMLPFLPRGQYLTELSSARLFSLLSAYESFPQSVNEAQAVGTPVVVAEPWGRNFTGRTKTLILNMNQSNEKVASQLDDFLINSMSESKTEIPSWEHVVRERYLRLYEMALSG